MAKARRAKPRPSRYVVPVVVALLLIGGVILAVQRSSGGGTSAAPAADPTVLASQQTASGDPSGSATGASGADPAASPSATGPDDGGPSSAAPAGDGPSDTVSGSAEPSTGSTTSSAPAGTAAAAQQLLTACRAKVHGGDAVLATATVGVGHWAEHVQAQTDANSGKISVAAMDGIFKRTRLAGPDDVSRYTRAVQGHDALQGSCHAPAGTSASVSAQLSRCAERNQAQQPVLAAAAAGMADWTSHLGAMQRSRMGHVHDAQGVWIRAWRAAPPHLTAFSRAVAGFDAPSC